MFSIQHQRPLEGAPLKVHRPQLCLLCTFSGVMYLRLWNSCSSRYSMRSARPPRMVRAQRLPLRVVSWQLRGTTCSLNMSLGRERAHTQA